MRNFHKISAIVCCVKLRVVISLGQIRQLSERTVFTPKQFSWLKVKNIIELLLHLKFTCDRIYSRCSHAKICGGKNCSVLRWLLSFCNLFKNFYDLNCWDSLRGVFFKGHVYCPLKAWWIGFGIIFSIAAPNRISWRSKMPSDAVLCLNFHGISFQHGFAQIFLNSELNIFFALMLL